MSEGYSWSSSSDGGYRLPGSDHLGWWAAFAMILSVLLHVGVFFVLEQMKIRIPTGGELATNQVRVSRVESEPARITEPSMPEKTISPPETTDALLEEVDLLDKLPKDAEIDMKPEIDQAEYALKMSRPAAEGDPAAMAAEVASSFEIDSALPEIGREPTEFRPAAVGQLTVDPGAVQAEEDQIGKMTEAIIRRGAGGNVKDGALDGMASLDDMLDLPPNLLLGKKTMLPSDLLFEFNSAGLRESARVGLMKLALLMDRNPALYCWIEGHTDLIGSDEANLGLSTRRAEAVKAYLVNSLKMDASRIHTRGFGRFEPIVISGDAAAQSVNRRVEVRMRKTPPTGEQLKVTPKKAAVVEEEAGETPPPKAVLVKPKRVPPGEIVAPGGGAEISPPRARIAPAEEPAPPRARIAPAEEIPRRASPVEEPPARAEPLESEPGLPSLEALRALPIEE